MKIYYGLILCMYVGLYGVRFTKKEDPTCRLKEEFCTSYNCSLKRLYVVKKLITHIVCNSCQKRYSSMGTIASHLEQQLYKTLSAMEKEVSITISSTLLQLHTKS